MDDDSNNIVARLRDWALGQSTQPRAAYDARVDLLPRTLT